MVVWRCTRNCVGSCTYCSYIKEYAKDQELNTAQAKHMVDEMAEFGSQWLGISGGEPLVRPDVWEVIEYAEKQHGMKVSLITSGFAWDEERFNKLTKYEVHTAISIDGEQRNKRHDTPKRRLRQSPARHGETQQRRLTRLLSYNHD